MATKKGKNTRRNIENQGEIIYQRPLGLTPWANNAGTKESGSVWISMKPKKITDQFTKAQGDIATVDLNSEFLFLAPLTLNENIVHHWEAYESVASRLAQKVRSAVKLGAEGVALTNVFGKKGNLADKFKNLFTQKGQNVGTAVEEAIFDVYNAVPGSRIPNVKVDTPLYYSNSDRRQIVFEFVLFHENLGGGDPRDVLIKPIQELMKYSSPDLLSDINIEFPFMWSVNTLPVKFINYPTCVLTAVQPTWNSPYINHVPASVNLQLTFTDMSPLYAGTIEQGTVINVITREKSEAKKAQQQFPTTHTSNYFEKRGVTGETIPQVIKQ